MAAKKNITKRSVHEASATLAGEIEKHSTKQYTLKKPLTRLISFASG